MNIRNLFRYILITACMTAGAIGAGGQQLIPDDPEVITGRLDNGMTYYLRHNSNPKGCADFYIAHNVGALQEEDNQNGLAHFLEHMAFNGTRHYPGKTLFDFLAKEGVRFGYNINAYTSKTETVYNLSDIPLVRESFIDSVMLVLRDWSCDISCIQEALDEERGVISEEWRRGDEQRARMAAAQNALVYKGAKHARRNVIGTLEIINGFHRDEIIDFYRKWYRPDLQAIIIVGDFDPTDMEKRVRRMFSDIPASENPVPKETYTVPALTEPLFENMTDPDIRFQTLKVLHRLPYPAAEERCTEDFWKQHYLKQIVTSVIEKRLRQAAKGKDCPVSSAVIVTNSLSADFYTPLFTLSAKSDKLLEETLRFYCRESGRILRHGFTEDEFNVARFHVIRRNHLDTDKYASEVTNEELVRICKEHFLRSKPTTFPTDLHTIQKRIISEITYEEALSCLQEMIGDSEKIYSYTIGTQKKHLLPDAARMKEIIAETALEDLKDMPVTFKKADLDIKAAAGKITGTENVKGSEGCEKWTLSNGATVYWIPSKEVRSDIHLAMELRFDTGYKTLPQDGIGAAKAATSYIGRNAGFGATGLNDITSSPECGGVRITFGFDKGHSAIKVAAGKDDAETAFRMAHQYLSVPYFDTEANLKRFKANNLRLLGNAEGPLRKFERERTAAKMPGHPWTSYVDSAAVAALDMDIVKDTYNRCFSNPEDMTVFICSDLDETAVKDMVEKYLASWNSGFKPAKTEAAPYVPSYSGSHTLDRTYPATSAPKVDIQYGFLAAMKPAPKTETAYAVLDYIMSQRCVSRIREERGGTYYVRFTTENHLYGGVRESVVAFQTRPEMVDMLLKDTQDLFDDLSKNGPTADEMDNAVKYLVKADLEKKQRFENSLSNRLGRYMNYIVYGIPCDFDYEKSIRSLKAKDIRKLARKVNGGDRFISIYREQ